jgi:hypothetical protein
MWNKFFELARWILLLTENTQKVRADLNTLQQDFKRHVEKSETEDRELRAALERLAYEVRRVSEHDEHEREKLLLRIENQLLRLSLPPAARNESSLTRQSTDKDDVGDAEES